MNEHNIQCQIIQLLRWNKIECFAVPNGIFFNSTSKSKSYAYINKLKAEGFTSGVSDIIILLPQGKTVFVEVKAEKGKQSSTQKEFELKVKDLGFKYYIWRSLEDAELFIKELCR